MNAEQPPMDQHEILKSQGMSFGTQTGILAGLFGGGLIVSQIIVSLLLFSGTTNLADAMSLLNSPDKEVISALKLGQLLAALGTFLLPAIAFTLILKEPFFRFIGAGITPNALGLLFTPLAVLCSFPLIAWLATLNAELPLPDVLVQMEQNAESLTRAFLRSEDIGDLFINLGVVAVAAAVTEEIFFRGCLQKLLLQWIKNHHAAIWITAFFFSFLHFQFLGFLPRMLLGALMGYLFVWSGNIWIPMLAHFVNNGTGVWVNYMVQKGQFSASVETYGSEGSDWPGIVLGTLLLAGILFLFPKKKPET